MTARTGSEWKDPGRAEAWPSFREGLPHVPDAEAMLVDHLVRGDVRRILDLGSGDGHLIALLKGLWPAASAVGLDLSPALIGAGRLRFADHDEVRFEVHDLMRPLPPALGPFDVVVSGLAIHHLPDGRKRTLFAEAFELLTGGGVFYDLDCVASPTPELHALNQAAFGFDERKAAVGCDEQGGDPSDQPARLQDELTWLRDAGFEQVDCFWKWLELAVVGGRKPS